MTTNPVPRVVLVQTVLPGSGSNLLQEVAMVYLNERELRVYAPSAAKGEALDWAAHFTVRRQGGFFSEEDEQDRYKELALRAVKKLWKISIGTYTEQTERTQTVFIAAPKYAGAATSSIVTGCLSIQRRIAPNAAHHAFMNARPAKNLSTVPSYSRTQGATFCRSSAIAAESLIRGWQTVWIPPVICFGTTTSSPWRIGKTSGMT